MIKKSKEVPIVICGVAGRVGQAILKSAMANKNLKVVGAVEKAGHPCLGRWTGELVGSAERGVIITDDLASILRRGWVVITFTAAEASMKDLRTAAAKKCPIVIGTTGFTNAQKNEIQRAGKKIPVLCASNMSIGVNLLWKVVGEIAGGLKDFEVEIVEVHHNKKKDSPSGTALTTAQIIAERTGRSIQKNAVYGRHGQSTLRKPGEIGIHAVRLGDVVGEHTVIFAGPGERLEITHKAYSRDNFALGALKAAIFLYGKKRGTYNMNEVLGIN